MSDGGSKFIHLSSHLFSFIVVILQEFEVKCEFASYKYNQSCVQQCPERLIANSVSRVCENLIEGIELIKMHFYNYNYNIFHSLN